MITTGTMSADRISGGVIKADVTLGTAYELRIGGAIFSADTSTSVNISARYINLGDVVNMPDGSSIYIGNETLDSYIKSFTS
jgi:hypothetical protein